MGYCPLVKLPCQGVEFEIAGAPLPNMDAMMADTAADLKSTAMVPVPDDEDTCSPQLQLPVLEPCILGFSVFPNWSLVCSFQIDYFLIIT